MLKLCHSKLKSTQKKLFMNERSVRGFPLVLGSYYIPFQARVNEKVYIPPYLVRLFHNANILVKALNQLLNQISKVLWKVVKCDRRKRTSLSRVGVNSSVYIHRMLKLCHSKLKSTQKKLFMNERSVRDFPLCSAATTFRFKHELMRKFTSHRTW